MRIPHSCLLICVWLLQVGALELWKEPNYSEPMVEPRLNTAYKNFIRQHIDRDMTTDKCDSEMMKKEIYGPNNSCKKVNTFILAPPKEVKSICRGQTPNDPEEKRSSKEKFSIVVCKLKEEKPTCHYEGELLTNRSVVVICQRGFPVHYEKNE